MWADQVQVAHFSVGWTSTSYVGLPGASSILKRWLDEYLAHSSKHWSDKYLVCGVTRCK